MSSRPKRDSSMRWKRCISEGAGTRSRAGRAVVIVTPGWTRSGDGPAPAPGPSSYPVLRPVFRAPRSLLHLRPVIVNDLLAGLLDVGDRLLRLLLPLDDPQGPLIDDRAQVEVEGRAVARRRVL